MTDELNVLAGAYALDALDEAERQQFEEHLATCAECADEVAGLRAAAIELSRTTEVAPPPRLRADVLAAVSQVRPLPPVVDDLAALRRARASRSTWQVLAAACAVVAIAMSAWGLSERHSAHQSVAARNPAVSSTLPNSDLSATTTSLSQGSGTVIYARNEHKVVLIGRNMSTLPSGRTYQLWMLPATGPAVSAGTFAIDGAGNVAYQTDGDLSQYDRMGISVEPAGGSKQPTPSTVQLLNI